MSTDKGTSDGRAGVSRTLAFGGEDDDTAASHGDQVVSGGEEHGVTPVREQSSREGALVSPPLTGDDDEMSPSDEFSPATKAVLRESFTVELPPAGERDSAAFERVLAELGAYIDRVMTRSGLPCEKVLAATCMSYREFMYDLFDYDTWNSE
jgi:hypothetical protein